MDRCVRYADANLIWPERCGVAAFDQKHSPRFSEFVVDDSSHANLQRLGAGVVRPVIKTEAPSFTNCLAVASPIPLFPPVIRAISPSSLPMQASSELAFALLRQSRRGDHRSKIAVVGYWQDCASPHGDYVSRSVPSSAGHRFSKSLSRCSPRSNRAWIRFCVSGHVSAV